MEINFNDLLIKYKDNKLIIPILYQISNNLENKEEIIKNIKKFYKKSNTNHNIIIKIILLLLDSVTIISNLPHIFNNIMCKNKPSLHILFSETISQLVSIILLSEIFLYIIKLNTDIKNKIKIIKKINNIQSYTNNKLFLTKDKNNLNNLYKDFILNSYNLTKELILLLENT